MTDRMTERIDNLDTPSSADTNAPLFDETGSAQSIGTTSASSTTSSTDSDPKQAASAVAKDAKESTMGVASTAASEIKDVAADAGTQLRQLLGQLGSEASDQAAGQTQRAVDGLRSLGDELSGMADSQQDSSGLASDLARQGASRLGSAADWLDGRQPGDILDEVRSFARRRPGAFIAGAAVLGLIGGRLTRGLTADSSSGSGESAGAGSDFTAPGFAGQTGSAGTYAGGTATGYATGYGDATAYAASPVDLAGTDPTRVDAGIDPATYTHPGSSTGVTGEPR